MDDDLRNRFRRDFTNEVIRPARPKPATDLSAVRPKSAPAGRPAHQHQSPARQTHPAPAHSYPAKRRKRRRRLLITLIILILICAAGGGGYWYWSTKLVSPVPASVRAAVDFPVLYPTKLPAGYHLDKTSFSTSGNVILYSAVNAADDKIAFTDQQRPASFDFNSFYTKGLSDPTSFSTPLGQAAIGTANGKLLGSLATDQSWLLVSSASKSVQSDDLRLILSNLKLPAR